MTHLLNTASIDCEDADFKQRLTALGVADLDLHVCGCIAGTTMYIGHHNGKVVFSEGFPASSEHTLPLTPDSYIPDHPLIYPFFTFSGKSAVQVFEGLTYDLATDIGDLNAFIQNAIVRLSTNTPAPSQEEKKQEVKQPDIPSPPVEVPQPEPSGILVPDGFDSLDCDVDYDKYVAAVFSRVKDNERQKLRDFMLAFMARTDLDLIRFLNQKHRVMDVLLYDTPQMKTALTNYWSFILAKKEPPQVTLMFSQNITTSATMGKVPQSEDKKEAYVAISTSSMAGEAVYLNPHVSQLQRVPVVDDTKSIYHALVNERCHEIVAKQIKDTMGDTIAESLPPKSIILKTLSKSVVNELADVQIVSYKDAPQDLAVRFASQGAQAQGMSPDIIQRTTIPQLAYNLAFGQPSYYNLLYGIHLDVNLKKAVQTTLRKAVRIRRAKSMVKNIQELMSAVRQKGLTHFDEEKIPPRIKAGRTVFKAGEYAEKVSDYLKSALEVRKHILSDRSSFATFYKYFSGDMTETLDHRALNDVHARGADVLCMDSMEYVRVGRLLPPLSNRVRPAQHSHDEKLASSALHSEFDKEPGDTFFLIDYSNKNVIEHRVSAYNSTADMTQKRTGPGGDSRAILMLEDCDQSGVRAQLLHIAENLKMCKERLGYKQWKYGAIVPFASLGDFTRQGIAHVSLAPYPNTGSFYVIFTSTVERSFSVDYVANLITQRKMMTLALVDAYMSGIQDLFSLTMERMEPPPNPLTLYWYSNIFVPRYKTKRLCQYTPFVDAGKTSKFSGLKRQHAALMESLDMGDIGDTAPEPTPEEIAQGDEESLITRLKTAMSV